MDEIKPLNGLTKEETNGVFNSLSYACEKLDKMFATNNDGKKFKFVYDNEKLDIKLEVIINKVK